jgi:hypothetical protein
MKPAITILLCLFMFSSSAQETTTSTSEQLLENEAERAEDIEPEDDYFLQQMEYFRKNPFNLNTVTEEVLISIRIITPLQIRNFLQYRKIAGPFISVYELQAVPGWDVSLVRRLLSYITVKDEGDMIVNLAKRFRSGEHSILGRTSIILEKSKGYTVKDSGANYYQGDRSRVLLRYKYRLGNLLQYGITAEKDAGEPFFGKKQKAGFDFYSFHFFIRNAGAIRALALGDFSVNMGQGLIHWQSLAFRKSVDVIQVKRQSELLLPYNSSDENRFHRGAAITLGRKKFSFSSFVARDRLDANRITDTLQNEDYFSSLQTSGYHRTQTEMEDKDALRQWVWGGNISYKSGAFKLAASGIYYLLDKPIQKKDEPYNLYAINGKKWFNYSIDYSYTFKNLHVFGEAAMSRNGYTAFINGLLMSVHPKADISILHRHISPGFRSFSGNAFTETTEPNNEKGLFAGIVLRPLPAWRIDFYTDHFSFPWLKFRIDAPGGGSDYLLQVNYTPNKQLEIYSRYKTEKKQINLNNGSQVLNEVTSVPRYNWRTQIAYTLNRNLQLRSRMEVTWYSPKTPEKENGFLFFIDGSYQPPLSPWAFNGRLQYFETDGYNSRLYAYENDVQYYYSVPVFYNKGGRYYINIGYKAGSKTRFWFKWSQTLLKDGSGFGSGLDEIKGNHRSELRLQVMHHF